MTWKEKLITRSKPLNKTILDYGCGTGIFLKHCADKHWNITGVEPSEQARAIAITNTKASIQPNIISIPQPHFEVITLWHVLEHLRDLNQTLTSLTQKLSKTGTMFIAVPNYKSQDAEFYANFWAAYDVPRHLWHFSKTTMQQLLKQHRLKTTEIIPMKLDAYYVSMLSEKYKHNDHQTLRTLLPAIAIATRSNIMAKRTGEYSSLIYVIRHETA
ncbi:MAG: class I SAM-dependent methyltransferase [Chryseolinea sp.]